MPDAVAFYAAEALAAHAAMDKVGVPREAHGEKLSLSQRVEVMAETMLDLTSEVMDCVGRKEV